jgi:hypothetical protein
LKRSLKIVTFFVLAGLLSLAYACGTKPKEEGKVEAAKAPKIQKLNVDMDTEKKYQDAADKGFQPWKKDATEVAKECLINQGVGAPSGDCKIVSDDGKDTVVIVNTKDGNFKVRLKRLVKPDGIWTATEIEKEG